MCQPWFNNAMEILKLVVDGIVKSHVQPCFAANKQTSCPSAPESVLYADVNRMWSLAQVTFELMFFSVVIYGI